jgi:hypothetical protein
MMALAVLIALTPMGIYGLKLWRDVLEQRLNDRERFFELNDD